MLKKIFQHFFKTQCLDSASVLSFSTILALVPTLALMLSIFSISPYFQTLQVEFEQFLFKNLLPENHQIIETYLHKFIAQTSQLTSISLIFLVISAILLFFEIDKKINSIWDFNYKRYWLKGLSSYILLLFFGPLLLSFFLFISSYLTINNHLLNANLLSFISGVMGFTLFFIITPIAKIKFINAFKAGIITAIGLEILKLAIAIYIANFPSYQIIYGAFATIPLFILWIYAVWLVILFGATCCYQFESHKKNE
jgi:membrane protein